MPERLPKDSELFYQQNSLANPFLDSLITNPGNFAEISTILFPLPPPVLDSVSLAEGFRVQVFAGLDSVKGILLKQKLLPLLTDSVHIIRESGLFKVQVGDFLKRHRADSLQRILTLNSVPGSWVVKRLVNVPIPVSSDSTSASLAGQDTPNFNIQILATSDESKAMSLISQLQQKFSFVSFYLPAGDIYKVYVGKFGTKGAAASALEEVRAAGYEDAWIVRRTN